MDRGKEYFERFIKVAPISHALWRSVEAVEFSKIDIKPPSLDLGCGYGEFSSIVLPKLDLGVDINSADLEIAAKTKQYQKVEVADARKLPYQSDSYSTVVSVSVIEHIDSIERVIEEVQRVLRQGGTFVFSTPTTYMHQNLLFVNIFRSLKLTFFAECYVWLHNKVFQHKSIKSPEWWRNTLESSGFTIREFKGTISPRLLHLHELFLLLAVPSQVCRIIFGKRMIIFPRLRTKWFSPLFSKFTIPDQESYINIFVIAEKK